MCVLGPSEKGRSSCFLAAAIHAGDVMAHTWYVTFEVERRGVLPRRRSPRSTSTFASEGEAKSFAREKFNQGLVVTAGNLNPCSPRQIIPSQAIPAWIEAAPDGTEPGDPSAH